LKKDQTTLHDLAEITGRKLTLVIKEAKITEPGQRAHHIECYCSEKLFGKTEGLIGANPQWNQTFVLCVFVSFKLSRFKENF
jgi:hypothetical protein